MAKRFHYQNDILYIVINHSQGEIVFRDVDIE